MTTEIENALAGVQHEVQRRLGRCMLRLQQYEHLLKLLVGSMLVEGPPEHLDAIRDRQVGSVHKKNLGTLIGLFTNRHLTMESADPSIGPGKTAEGSELADEPWASINFTIAMPPERYAQTKAGLAELLELRNKLVHHFIEKYNLSEESECRAACDYLDDSYERIDGHFRNLSSLITVFEKYQAVISQLAQSDVFQNLFTQDFDLDDTICWTGSQIVDCLREAEKACTTDGWVLLNAAIGFISKKSPDQVPSGYGCRTWRQVLQRSGQFEIRRVAGSDGMVGQTWYRSRRTSL